VSHDRQFIDNLVTSCWVIAGDRQVGVYVGGFSDCERQGGLRDCFANAERQAASAAADAAPAADPLPSATHPAALAEPPAAKTGRKLSYKLQRELEGLPHRIEELEQEIARLSEEQGKPEFYARNHVEIAQHHQRLSAVQSELDAAYERWQELESM
jgi:ATP-binding cassette subfamily F protein uup